MTRIREEEEVSANNVGFFVVGFNPVMGVCGESRNLANFA